MQYCAHLLRWYEINMLQVVLSLQLQATNDLSPSFGLWGPCRWIYVWRKLIDLESGRVVWVKKVALIY